MNRLHLVWTHFRLFHNLQVRITIWPIIWLCQFLEAGIYYTGGDGLALQRLTLYPILIWVFCNGNGDSTRNRPFLRTRPLPAGTPFLSDAMLPFALFSLIPLLREIPLVIEYRLGFGNLMWAWFDFLALHGVFFTCAWSLGALLPSLNSPLKVFMTLFITGLIFISLTLFLQHTGTPVSTSRFWGNRHYQEVRYPVLWLCNAVVILITCCACRFHLRGRAAVGIFFLLQLPIATIMLWRLPEAIRHNLPSLDHALATTTQPEDQVHIATPSYQKLERDYTRIDRIHHSFPLIVESEHLPVEEMILRLEGYRIITENLTRWEAARSPDPFLREAIQAVLQKKYGPSAAENDAVFRPFPNTRRGASITFLRERFPQWEGGPVEIEAFCSLHRLTSVFVAEDQPLGSFTTHAHGPTGRVYATGAWESHRVIQDRDRGPANVIHRRVDLAFRQQNLFWKRLIHGRQEPFQIMAVFRDADTMENRVYLQTRVSPFQRLGDGPFSHPGINKLVERTSRYHQQHPEGERAGIRAAESVHLDLFVLTTAEAMRVKAVQYARLPPFSSPYHEADDPRLEDQPMGTWEVDLLQNRFHTRSLEIRTETKLFRHLANLPPHEYRSVLFEATKRNPKYAKFIEQNGWEEEAAAVWQDLARQEIRLPVSVLQIMLRSENPEIREALLHYQSWNPTPVLLAGSQLDPAFHQEMLAATELALSRMPPENPLVAPNWTPTRIQNHFAFTWLGAAITDLRKYYDRIPYPLPYPGGDRVLIEDGPYDSSRRRRILAEVP